MQHRVTEGSRDYSLRNVQRILDAFAIFKS